MIQRRKNYLKICVSVFKLYKQHWLELFYLIKCLYL